MIDWNDTPAAVWRAKSETLRKVKLIDLVLLDDLLGIDHQKRALIENTERFMKGMPCNHALLWGARGTGKSSLIKAVFNQYSDQGLRIVEVDRDHLVDLPEIIDHIREHKHRFIIYCDDLAFDADEKGYKGLKSVLEGSIEKPPENVRVYATSNRRHLVPEFRSDNEHAQVTETELHYSEAVEEKIALSDRFGLWLSFYSISQEAYLQIIDHLFREFSVSREELHLQAKQFATQRGGRSGRIARQFFNMYSGSVFSEQP